MNCLKCGSANVPTAARFCPNCGEAIQVMPASDFSAYIADRAKDFTGRDWVFAEIDHWLADPDAPHFFIITGEPGIGKTAIAARLAQIRDLAAIHFCIARQADTIDPLNFARSISRQLSQIDGFAKNILRDSDIKIQTQQNISENYDQVIGVKIENLVVNAPSATVAFTHTVLDPLRSLYAEGCDRQLLVVIDALDEAVQQPGMETIVDLLANAGGLPAQVRFLLTSRPEGAVLRHFEQQRIPHLLLDAGREENRQDICQYVRNQLGKSGELRAHLAERKMPADRFIELVTTASAGNFLYLVWLLPAIADGSQRFDRLSDLPKGLDGIYREFLRTRRVGKDIARWRQTYRPLLGTLAATQAPLTAEQLAHFTELNEQDIDDLLRDVQQFLDPRLAAGGQYQLYHQSVADFLSSREAQEFWIDLISAHRQIANYYLDTYGDNWTSCNDVYGLQNLAKHLVRANLIRELQVLIEDPGWYSIRSKHDPSRHGYVDDLDLAYDATASQGSQGWPHLAANSLIRATLTGVARYLPGEAYEALVRLGRGREALQRASIIPEASVRMQALKRIEGAARELNEGDLSGQVQEELASLPVSDEGLQPRDENAWLIPMVAHRGAEQTLRELVRMQTTHAPDRSEVVKLYLQVASVAFNLNQVEEAHKLLLECSELIGGTWLHERQRLLVQIARLLLEMGYEDDLPHIVELALNIEVEQVRVSTLAELALICSDASEEVLRRHALEIAVVQVEDAKRKLTLQFELSKVALAMAKVGDERASRFLSEAIRSAERPTQLAWHWQEKEARASLADALASVGLCDEALRLVGQIDPCEIQEGGIIVELALQGRWKDAWQLAQTLYPIIRKRALWDTANVLAKQGKLGDERSHAIIDQLESDLEDKNADDRLAELGRLIDIALLAQDESRARHYLSLMVSTLDETVTGRVGNALSSISGYAVELSEIALVRQFMDRVQALPEDNRYYNRSNAIATVVLSLANLGEVDDAWSLAQSISADVTRLEAYVRICELVHRQGKAVDRYFNESLVFARQIENVGWVPTFWGRLAVLAYQLGYKNEEVECADRAIEGTHNIAPSYSVEFNVCNSAYVAQSLHRIGVSAQAQELLEWGLSHIQQTGFDIGPLRRLVQAVIKVEANSLWPGVLQIAQAIKDPSEKAEALLGITCGIARLGDPERAIENLSLVLAAIQNAGRHKTMVIEFGSVLGELFQPESEALNYLIVDAFRHARLEDRPTVLIWIASLFPIFAKADSALAITTWKKVERIDAMLG
jgi:hypothetical protein